MLSGGEASKSTIFKQLRSLFHKDVFTKESRISYKDLVWSNILIGMQTLLQAQKDLLPLEPISSKNSTYAQLILDADKLRVDRVFPILAECIKTLWKEEPVLKKVILMKEKFQFHDCILSFLDREDVFEQHYVPTKEDVLSARLKTTGILWMDFAYQHKHFQVFDVGGQRNERKKCLIHFVFCLTIPSHHVSHRDSYF